MVLWRTQQRNYGYVHVPKKRTSHLLGSGSDWRKCFVVHPHTQISRPLESYQSLTCSVVEEGLPASLPLAEDRTEDEVLWLEERLMAAAGDQAQRGRKWLQGKKGIQRMRQIFSSALTGLWLSGEEHLQASSLTSNPRVESYWRCEGINYFCVSHPLLILHCSQPLALFADPTKYDLSTVPSLDHHPCHLRLFEHSFDQITPFAGCHRFSPISFTHTVFCMDQKAHSRDQILAHGLLQLFCQAAAECVQNGYQLNQDLVYPLTSQGVVTNGHQLTFLSYQLNTLNLRKGGRKNVVWMGPTLDLFSGQQINRECSKLLVQFIMHHPLGQRPVVSGFGLKRSEKKRAHS